MYLSYQASFTSKFLILNNKTEIITNTCSNDYYNTAITRAKEVDKMQKPHSTQEAFGETIKEFRL